MPSNAYEIQWTIINFQNYQNLHAYSYRRINIIQEGKKDIIMNRYYQKDILCTGQGIYVLYKYNIFPAGQLKILIIINIKN